LISTPDPNELRLARHRRALQAARRAGVQHVVYLSFLVNDPAAPFPFARSHLQTEEALMASGLAWTILRPSLYLDSLTMLAPEVNSQSVFHVPAGSGRASFLSRDDIAEAAARVVAEPGRAGAILPLTGTRAVSYLEVAETLSQHLGRAVRFVDVDEADYRRRAAAVMPGPMLDTFVLIWRTIREGWFSAVHPNAAEILGRDPTSVAKWLEDHRAQFTG
jgi:NAD(P)H dehydrogenase (quinone)